MESGRDYEHPRGRTKTAIKNSKELAGGGPRTTSKDKGSWAWRGHQGLVRRTLVELHPLLTWASPSPLARPTGYGEGFDDVIIQGDLEELKFVAFYTK